MEHFLTLNLTAETTKVFFGHGDGFRKADQKLPNGVLIHHFTGVPRFGRNGVRHDMAASDIVLYRMGNDREVLSRFAEFRPVPGGFVLVGVLSQKENKLYRMMSEANLRDGTLDDRIDMALGARGVTSKRPGGEAGV